ncbi:hypothetical protein DVH24_018695 [Malus domestica]|uniref:GATA-type domain-containing protein n=1 Tax=Malus domestica TaxID=3750 RepID=A0A498HKU4_MALDO|nr:hypothetical protein DVH24_018695 [Malus domestica]
MESLESFDELLDFPSDVGEEDKDEDFEASNALPGDDPSCQFSETEECSEEVLEWLSNKDAFPPVETFFGIDLSFAGIPWEGEQLSTNQSDNSGKDDMTKAETPMMEKTVGRQCHHCGTRKTSRWQAGPLGPKTLCNACWCWYKSVMIGGKCQHCGTLNTPQWRRVGRDTLCNACAIKLKHRSEILRRKCQDCETKKSTPQWREDCPKGKKALCDACYVRYKSDIIGRKCQRCGVQGRDQWEKMPACGTGNSLRWRAGPLGTNTLCDNCGLRYKSGRLFHEYRPASLTSFASKLQPKPPRKKKKIQNIETGIGGEAEIRVRKCQQCETEATPKWRSGPIGLKTLCNACWHRYEISKKLVTQCCPASSHTFSKKLRSNRHRKLSNVLRKKQEMETGDFPASSPTFPKKLRSNRHQKLSDILGKKQEMEISVEACV